MRTRLIGMMCLMILLTVLSAPAWAVSGPYFGQTPPGKTPQIFASGILSLTDRLEQSIAFSPDGLECFFTVPSSFSYSSIKLYYTKCVNNVWTSQGVAPFTLPGAQNWQPFFSADGNKLYFTSSSPGTGDIWVSSRTTSGWGSPVVLSSPINSTSWDGSYTQTTDGTIYFESERSGGLGYTDIWRTVPGTPSKVETLGSSVNSSSPDGDPFVSPDGSYLLFQSFRSGGSGNSDLYVTFSNGSGGWTTAVNMNQYCPGINTSAGEFEPTLSADGQYLFFVRIKTSANQSDIYWVVNPFYTAPEPATLIQLGLAAMMLGLVGIKHLRHRV
jgi:Tol biopolymer transport system component